MNLPNYIKYHTFYNKGVIVLSLVILAYLLGISYIFNTYPYLMDPIFQLVLFLFLFNFAVAIVTIIYGVAMKIPEVRRLGLKALLNQLLLFVTLLFTFAIGLSSIY